jgi:glycerol-3-phosphate dehydrogenase
MPSRQPEFDLLVIGGGINGAGIARDAAGRGLKVLMVEQGDLASATSQWSTKLIHGGLRYLEQYEFRLVHESLAEREVVLRQAPHIVEPLSFVLPHEPHLRPAWMLRAGLFLYDHLGRRDTLPGSFGVDLSCTPWGAGLKPKFGKGFVYSDARVDDARLVVFNVMDASLRGARVLVRTTLMSARRERDAAGSFWSATLRDVSGVLTDVTAKALVNAAGPWVKRVRDTINDMPSKEGVRHVKGSHIVVPRVHEGAHAYILQNADKRIVFVIPYQERYTLIGTTDVAVETFERPEISGDEIDYLLELSNTYLAQPLARVDVLWTYSGVRPLYDDGASDPSSITRDYVFKLDTGGKGGAAALSIYGGKITTYRKLAEHALDELKPFLPPMRPRWTASAILPGGDLPGGTAAWSAELIRRFPGLPASLLRSLARRHGTRALLVLGNAKKPADLGEDFGHGLLAAEIEYVVREEWARESEDVLWRRTKCGIGMSDGERGRVAAYVTKLVTAVTT